MAGKNVEKRDNQTLCCSFCGKSQKEVKKLIAGPTVYICDECIGLCNDIIAEEIDREETKDTKLRIPRPSEILMPHLAFARAKRIRTDVRGIELLVLKFHGAHSINIASP